MGTYEEGQGRSIHGIALGIVTENLDASGKHPGMVKTRISLEKEELVTDWVRVVQPCTGGDCGAYWLPEVGDEVLLAFHMGDLSRPYVIGSLRGANNKIPPQIPEADTVKRIKTKGGHEIVFSDEEGKECLEIHTPKNFKIILEDETQTILIRNKDEKNILKIDEQSGAIEIIAEKDISFNSA